MPSKVMLFVGAPASKTLTWKDDELCQHFGESFIRFARLPVEAGLKAIPGTSTSASVVDVPAWRYLPLERKHLMSGASQDHGWQPGFQGASFFTASFAEELSQKLLQDSYQSSVESVEQVLSQFYEESYALHEDIPSSELELTSYMESSYSSNEAGTSFNSTPAYLETPNAPPRYIPESGPLSNLNEFPNGNYINSIQPQVITVNLIVGVISVPSPRAIKTRIGANVELIEMLVGDETKSGFGVNFWASASQSADGSLKSSVESLRPQDVVLMRNVALSSFRGRVYGQSLRKGMTKVHLLYRNSVDRTDTRGCYRAADLEVGNMANPQLVKTQTVREWVLRFVGGGPGPMDEQERALDPPESLPPDTQ